jgi:UDP-N-acetylglucosamine pyrophosphorylase
MRIAIVDHLREAAGAVTSVFARVLGLPIALSGPSAPSDPASLSILESAKSAAAARIFAAEPGSADYFISITPGATRKFDGYYGFVFVAVADSTRNRFGFGTSTAFALPDSLVASLVRGALYAPGDFVFESIGAALNLDDLVSEALSIALIPFNFYETPIPDSAPPELLRFVPELTPLQRNTLAAQLTSLDFSRQKVVDETATTTALEAVPDPADYSTMFEDILLNGGQAIRAGEVAVLIMAGGQGSRLRAPVPKALMEIDIPSKMTLLEIQLRRIKKLLSLSGAPKTTGSTWLDIPVYILTSDSTHSAIAAYLLQKKNFGLAHVRLVKQRQLPAVTPGGEFVLSEKYKVMAAPNGNGAIFQELKDSGALDEMKRFGVKYVDVHPIENLLAKPADPFFVGALSYEEGDAGIKVVRKRPRERIGTLCKRGEKTVVVEYSEIPEGYEEAYCYGNTGLQLYSISVIEAAASAELPYHIARKRENIINEKGEQILGDVVKFERFVFDGLEYCENVVLIECNREEEFAPIKNENGAPVDSPETARDLLLALHRKWANENGITLEGDGPFEFLPETTYDGDSLYQYMGFSFTLPTCF